MDNRLSSYFPVFSLENRGFPGFSADFSTRRSHLFEGFPNSFPQPVKSGKIPLCRNTFSTFPTDGAFFSTDFSTSCGKLFSIASAVCHTCPNFFGQAATFGRQIDDICEKQSCHTDKMTPKQGFSRDFFRFFTEKHGLFPFPHEFSTECGKTCGKAIDYSFRQISKSP